MVGLRYLIAVARDGRPLPAELDAVLARLGLHAVNDDLGYRLYLTVPDRWARFADGRGVVVGDLFDRRGEMEATFDGRRAEHASDLDGILQNYWGGYVALRDGRREFAVFRDPSGALPAYHLARDDGWYVASDAPLLVEAGLYAPVIAWQEVAWFYYTNGLPSERTALASLEQIVPGAVLTLKPRATCSRLLWSPWQHVGGTDPGASALRATTLHCIRAWQARYGSVVVGVSGGLDSSIIACSLDRRGEVNGLTISTRDALGDEASYASLLCEALDILLFSGHYASATVDLRQPGLAHRPVPGGMAQLQAYDSVVIDSVAALGASTFMSGVGGDNVFNLTRSARPLVDRLLREGPTFGALRTLRDLCDITGAHPIAVIREAMRVPWRAGPKYAWPTDQRFLDPTVVESLANRSLDHPWLRPPNDCLPGKNAHVATIVRAHAYLECHDRRWGFASVHPLMSQPIIELMLATPSWAACENGVDRARARQAFADGLPDTILQRRLKGGPDGFALKLLRTQLPAIREILLDGRLVREGVIDRQSLELALNEQNLLQGRDYTRLLQLLDTEAWAQHWLSMLHA
ncbi:asparagine synthase-related protein [Sphingomonas sp. RB3P16]|uniref:asparagine synthase-related protein n=1 Tax=Parasphingomonas frigoris TaxID=3096163 RepID=UPI002FC8534F